MLIAVRGGHNYNVRGSKGIVDEVDEDRLYSKALVLELEKLGHTVYDVTPYKTNTKSEDLKHGVALANKYKVDLYISCHLNAFNGKANGSEVIYSNLESKEIAMRICDKLEKLGFKNRGAKSDTRGLYEIRHTKMPTVIIEPFFLDNIDDVALYNKVGYIGLAKAITEGIVNKKIEVQGVDEDMLPTVKLSACVDSKIKGVMSNYIKGLQSCIYLSEDGIATQELCLKLPIFKGGEEKGSASILQELLQLKGYLSKGKILPLGQSVKDAVDKLRKDNGLPASNTITDPLVWRKLIEY